MNAENQGHRSHNIKDVWSHLEKSFDRFKLLEAEAEVDLASHFCNEEVDMNDGHEGLNNLEEDVEDLMDLVATATYNCMLIKQMLSCCYNLKYVSYKV